MNKIGMVDCSIITMMMTMSMNNRTYQSILKFHSTIVLQVIPPMKKNLMVNLKVSALRQIRTASVSSVNFSVTFLIFTILILDKTFVCHLCRLTFTAQSSLRRHMHRHFTDRERFECEICHNSYSRKDYLKEHKKTKHQIIS